MNRGFVKLAAALLAFGLCAAPAGLAADLLLLKNGEKLIGYFEEESVDSVNFVTLDGEERTVQRSEIAELQLGFTGAPACYTLVANPEEQLCNVLVHELRDGAVVFAEGEGFTELRTVSSGEVRSVEISRVTRFHKVSTILRSGLEVRVRSGDEVSEGVIDSVEEGRIFVRLGDGEVRELGDDAIQIVFFQPPPSTDPTPAPGRDYGLYALIPGYPQLDSGRTPVGWTMLGGVSVSLIGFYMEYRAAVQAAQAAASDPTVLLFNNTSHLDAFQKHQTNQAYLLGLAAALYLWHLADYFYLSPPVAPAPGLEATPAEGVFFEGRLQQLGARQELIQEAGYLWRF
jgi:hypothetical protein